MEPAKYPPNVKLVIFSQLQSAREGSIMRTVRRGGIGAFIVVEFCLPSLQPKLFPCRTLPSGIQNVVDKLFFREESMVLRCSPKILPMLYPILIGPLFYHGFHTKDGIDFLLAHGHRPVRPTRLGPSGLAFYFYPLQFLCQQLYF